MKKNLDENAIKIASNLRAESPISDVEDLDNKSLLLESKLRELEESQRVKREENSALHSKLSNLNKRKGSVDKNRSLDSISDVPDLDQLQVIKFTLFI